MPDLLAIILFVSILLQITAAVLALRLIAVTGRALAWILISAAIVLMSIRRIVSLLSHLEAGVPTHDSLDAELIALVIAFLMAAGLYAIRPLFLRLQQITETIRSREADLAAILALAPCVVLTLDTDQRITRFNRYAEKTFGWKAVDILGQSLDVLIPATEGFSGPVTSMLPAGKEYLAYAQRRDGSQFRATVTIARLERMGMDQYIVVIHDLTDQEALQEKALALAIEQEKVRLLRDFIGDASHNLRTPLTVIKNSVYLLGKTTDPARQGRYLQALKDESRFLERLIENLLTLSRLDSHTELEMAPCSLNSLVTMIVGQMQASGQTDGVHLAVQLDASLPQVKIDREQVGQALANLLDNAIAYSPAGGAITVRTHAHKNALCVSVIDNGIGIRPDEQQRIFERFYRSEDAQLHHRGGTGLGLAIAHKIIAMHGGTIEVESQPGYGSTFCMMFPAAVQEGDPAAIHEGDLVAV